MTKPTKDEQNHPTFIEYKNKAQRDCNKVSQWSTCEVIKTDNSWCDHTAIMTVADTRFIVDTDYHGNFNVRLEKYDRYDKVSNEKARQVREEFALNNMKVVTEKKLIAHVNAVTSIRDKMASLQKQAIEKERMFLCDINALKLDFTFSYNQEYKTLDTGEYKAVNTDIKGGYVVKNGIEYSFEFGTDGHVAQRVKLHYYSGNDTIKDFLALSDNSYKAK